MLMHGFDTKYVERLADVYIEKYEKEGHEKAKEWYNRFLTAGPLRALVRTQITTVLKKRGKKSK